MIYLEYQVNKCDQTVMKTFAMCFCTRSVFLSNPDSSFSFEDCIKALFRGM